MRQQVFTIQLQIVLLSQNGCQIQIQTNLSLLYMSFSTNIIRCSLLCFSCWFCCGCWEDPDAAALLPLLMSLLIRFLAFAALALGLSSAIIRLHLHQIGKAVTVVNVCPPPLCCVGQQRANYTDLVHRFDKALLTMAQTGVHETGSRENMSHCV